MTILLTLSLWYFNIETCSNNISATRNWFMDAFRKDFAIPGMARFRPPKEEEEGEGGEEEDEWE